MEKSAVIFYFSGTGNTWWVGEQLAQQLSEAGITTTTYSIEQITQEEVGTLIEGASIVGLGYPIYGSDAPEIMKTFIEILPTVPEPKPMCIYVTQMEWSGNGAYFLRKKIEAKGYQVKWAIHFKMPSNIGMDIFPLAATSEYAAFEKKLTAAKKQAQKLTQCIIDDKQWIHSKNPLGWASAWIQRGPFRWILKWAQGRTYSVDPDKCSHCGRCERICPVGNIQLNEEGLPEWGNECILCVRCFNYCPEQAILAYKRPFNQKRFGEKPFQGPIPAFKPELIIKKKK